MSWISKYLDGKNVFQISFVPSFSPTLWFSMRHLEIKIGLKLPEIFDFKNGNS